jgi:hypothetical protein
MEHLWGRYIGHLLALSLERRGIVPLLGPISRLALVISLWKTFAGRKFRIAGRVIRCSPAQMSTVGDAPAGRGGYPVDRPARGMRQARRRRHQTNVGPRGTFLLML